MLGDIVSVVILGFLGDVIMLNDVDWYVLIIVFDFIELGNFIIVVFYWMVIVNGIIFLVNYFVYVKYYLNV